MKLKTMTLLICLGTALLGCTQEETYPLSGDQCGPNDPVLDMRIPDCLPTI